MDLKGKGFYIWKIKNCEGGDPDKIAARAREAQLTHVLIKIANGIYAYNYDWDQHLDLVPPVAQALKARGIKVWGWHYLYGDSPIGEARKAVERVQELSLDGYVIDAEGPFKKPGKRDAAKRFMQELRRSLPNYPIGLTSYRYPSYHPQFPWREFLEGVDFNMPQVYWVSAHNPGAQLTRSLREFQSMTPFRPLMPIGAAYRAGTWLPTPGEVVEFLRTTQSLNLSSASFWEWSFARSDYLIQVWDAIRDYSWSGSPVPSDIVEQYIAHLNSRDPQKVVSLYAPSAAHVSGSQTVTGPQAIRTWYQTLFTNVLPHGKFTLAGFTGTGNSRHFTWTATSSQGKVHDGNDVFGLLNGKIVYHYTFFNVSPN